MEPKGEAMSSTEARISITVKTTIGSLVTVRAESEQELDNVIALALESIKSAVTELEASVAGRPAAQAPIVGLTPNAQSLLQSSLGATVVQDVPPFNPTFAAGGGRNCKHGKMTGIQGASKDGGIYKGYFCPSPQGTVDKCKTQYLQKHDPEFVTFVADRIK
jgi:hypothetical protein